MLEYCCCPKCDKMIMLDADLETGFCLYCGTHIAYDEAREELLNGLRASIPAELTPTERLSDFIGEEGENTDDSPSENTENSEEFDCALAECREEYNKAQEHMAKWDFGSAFECFTRALEWCPTDFDSICGKMTAGILRLRDVCNWEAYLGECIGAIRGQNDWSVAQVSVEFVLDVMRRFLSKGGRFVSPKLTEGFFRRITESFPSLRFKAVEIFAHCLNVDYAPFTDAARLDHETTRFAVGYYPTEQDKTLHSGMLLVMKYHPDARVKESLCRALFVYDRSGWLRSKDRLRIDDAICLMEGIATGEFPPEDVKIVINTIYDLLMMGGLEQNTTPTEKRLFLSGVYSIQQMQRMERFFSGSLFFNRVYSDIYLMQKGANPLSAEYKRIQNKIQELT